jgi:hypothetical protein
MTRAASRLRSGLSAPALPLRGLRIAATACLKREGNILGVLAEQDRWNAKTLQDPTTGHGATFAPPSAPFLNAALPPAPRHAAEGDGYRAELASD